MVRTRVGRIGLGLVFAVGLATVSSGLLALAPTTVVVPFERSGPQVLDANGLPIAGGFFNPCTSELVDVTGSSTITLTDVLLNNGERRTTIDVDTTGTGVGQLSQVIYPFREDQSFNVKRPISGGLAFESVFTDKIRMRGPGNIDDWTLRATFRIKVNDLGEVLVNVVRISDQDGCTGRALTNAAPNTSTLQEAPAGLVAAYSFDEGSGLTTTDLSGNANTGTIRGAAFAPGKAGKALKFDGVDDWVTILHKPSLALTTGMTIEAWVQPTKSSGWETVVLKERGAMNMAYGLYAHDGAPLASGVAAPAGYVNVAGVHQASRGISPVGDGDWTYLAATYDGALLRLYVNGALIASRAQTGTIVASTSPLRIGGNAAWTGEFFAGLIDDVRVYNRALRPEEIVRDMNTPLR